MNNWWSDRARWLKRTNRGGAEHEQGGEGRNTPQVELSVTRCRRLRFGLSRGGCLAALLLATVLLPTESAVAHAPSRTTKWAPERSAADEFQKVTLNGEPGEPIGLAVLPDGRVLHTTRGGRVWLHDPSTGFNTVAADIPVYSHDEEGLQGIAIDPHFWFNRWVYIYYSPPLDTPLDDPATPDVNEGDAPAWGEPEDFAPFRGYMLLSRFKLRENQLDLESEQRILEVPSDRGICCHVGGDIDFDRHGNLLLSTGDDSNPFESDGFSPLDARPGRHPAFDARRSSGNTNDLRGKLLRIRVNPDGSYGIPRGNLFPVGMPRVRPEIYAMGLRNPFRFAVDSKTGAIYLADYSPDALDADPERGPSGHGKWVRLRPGNYGWPFCATPQTPYGRYDFEGGVSELYDCRRLVNDSPHNTGLRRLPPVLSPEVAYGAAPSERFPELGAGGVGPMAGPAYDYNPWLRSDRKWPRWYEGVPLFYEWTRDALFFFELSPWTPKWRHAQVTAIEPFLPDVVFENPIDLEFGPDGALYVLEYGDGYFGENPEAQLSRVDYLRGNATPVAVASADVQYGFPPLSVQLSSEGSHDPDGDALEYFWDFDSDGSVDSTEPNPVVVYDAVGNLRPNLRVVDATGRSSTTAVRIISGNTPPSVEFLSPVEGQPFSFGDTVSYEVRVTDDTPVDCSRVTVEYVLVHDDHGHPLSSARGCAGQFSTVLDEGHAGVESLFIALVASYTDEPEDPEAPVLAGESFILLFPTSPAAD